MYNNGATDWSGKMVKIVPDSSCEAETAVASEAATRAATWSTAPVYCPFRVNYKVHTQLTLLHYCGYSTVVPSYHTPTLLVHMD